jgi:hypothetical protein
MNEERAIADMMEFVSKFSSLMSAQLKEVQETLHSTCNEMMNNIQTINEIADTKKNMADEVLVKDAASSKFISKKMSEISSNSSSQAADFSDALSATKQKFAAHSESFQELDETVRNLLFSMMGALSMDDVVQQRLEHVAFGMGEMSASLEKNLLKTKNEFNATTVESLSASLLSAMFKSYTMETEKQVFKSVFTNTKF